MIDLILSSYLKRDEIYLNKIFVDKQKPVILISEIDKSEILYWFFIFINFCCSTISKTKQNYTIYFESANDIENIKQIVAELIKLIINKKIEIDENIWQINEKTFLNFKVLNKNGKVQNNSFLFLKTLTFLLDKQKLNNKRIIAIIDPVSHKSQNIINFKNNALKVIKSKKQTDYFFIVDKKYIQNQDTNFEYFCETIPPTIDDFITDPFYLGKVLVDANGKCQVYSIWREVLNDVYPDRYTTNVAEIYLSGGIGLGKTTISKIIILYDICRLLCLRNPHSYFNLLPTTVIRYMLMNINIKLSKSVLYHELIEWVENSPFFQKNINKDKNAKTLFVKNIDIGYGSRGKDALGQATVGAILSEINDMTVVKDQGTDVFDTIYTRMQSRFGSSGRPTLGHLILDSSSQGSESFVENRISEKKKKNITDYRYYAFAHWEAKRDTNFYKGETFKVFKGNKNIDPYIVANDAIIDDPEIENNIINVPVEHYQEFQFNIKKSLRDLAGIATFGNYNYISSVEVIHKILDKNRKPSRKEIIYLDFFNQDKLLGYVDIHQLNHNQPHSIHIDLGLKNDSTGISSCYVSHYIDIETIDFNGNTVIDRRPFFVVDFSLEIRCNLGQEVPIYKIKDFILELRKIGYKIETVSTDGFQSSNIRQDLEVLGFKTELLSVDRTKEPYDLLRDIIFENRVSIPFSEKIIDEFLSLEDVGKKYDHPIGKSKDIIDSICGSVFMKNSNITQTDRKDLQVFNKSLQLLYNNQKNTKTLIKTNSENKLAINKLNQMFFKKR